MYTHCQSQSLSEPLPEFVYYIFISHRIGYVEVKTIRNEKRSETDRLTNKLTLTDRQTDRQTDRPTD